MGEARSRLTTVGAAVAALIVVLVALSPTILFSEPLSAFDLIALGASLLVVGVLLRWRRGTSASTLGTLLAIIGAVVLVVGLGVAVLLLAGWGWGP